MHNDPTPPTIPYDAFQSACNALALRAVPYVEHPAGGWRPADPSPDYDLAGEFRAILPVAAGLWRYCRCICV